MTQAWAKAARRHRQRQRLHEEQQRSPAAMNGTTWATVMAVHMQAGAVQAARVGARAPVDGGQLGERLGGHRAAAQPPEIGRRMITSSAPTGSSRTCSAWPSPVETIAK